MGESPWPAVVREVREEVGVHTEVLWLLGVYSNHPRMTRVSFLCRVIAGEPYSADDESDAIRWFATDSLPPNTLPRQRARILDALDDRVECLLSEHRFGRGPRSPSRTSPIIVPVVPHMTAEVGDDG